MIASLRNNHFRIWIILAIVIPVAFIYAFMNVPERRISHFSRELIGQMPELIKEIENDDLKVTVRGNQNSQHQLEVLLKRPVPVPSGVFHLVNNNEAISNQSFLGNVNSQGLYRFPIQSNPFQSDFRLLVVDYLTKSIILEIRLNGSELYIYLMEQAEEALRYCSMGRYSTLFYYLYSVRWYF